MPGRKKRYPEDNEVLQENASPVCYLHAAELRPEFQEESNQSLKIQTDNNDKRTGNMSGKKSKKPDR